MFTVAEDNISKALFWYENTVFGGMVRVGPLPFIYSNNPLTYPTKEMM